MKNLVGTAVAVAMTVVLATGANAQVGNQDEDGGFAEADAASLSVELAPENDGWCAADAGSLGHADPVGACN